MNGLRMNNIAYMICMKELYIRRMQLASILSRSICDKLMETLKKPTVNNACRTALTNRLPTSQLMDTDLYPIKLLQKLSGSF